MRKRRDGNQVSSRPGGRCDMRPSRINISDYIIKTMHFRWWHLIEDMCTIGRWSVWSCLMQIDPTFTKICAKNDFYFFISSDLDLWPFHQIRSLVTLVQRCVSTKLEVSEAFLCRTGRTDGRTDGQTDGVKHLMRPPTVGRIINFSYQLLYHPSLVRELFLVILPSSPDWFLRCPIYDIKPAPCRVTANHPRSCSLLGLQLDRARR